MSEIINAEYKEIYVVNENDVEKLQKTEVEINALTLQANQMALTYVIAIGKKLSEAKALVNHGQWGEWCDKKINYSQSTAENYIKIYEEYGSEQLSLLSNTNSETIMKLPYSKALALIVLPADEREKFIEENNVENISVRELKELLKDKEKENSNMGDTINNLKKVISDKEAQIEELNNKLENDSDEVSFDDEALKKIREEIAKEQKEEYKRKIDKLTAEKKEFSERVKNLEEKIDEINEDSDHIIEMLKEEKEAAEKKVKQLQNMSVNSGKLQIINMHLDNLQDCVQKIYNEIEPLKTEDKTTADKICNGIKAMLEEFKNRF